jgi:hypothetical protein
MLATKMVLAISVGLVVLFLAEAAYAQRNRPAPKSYSYDAVQTKPGGSRFTPEEQRIIDQITENGWRNGR